MDNTAVPVAVTAVIGACLLALLVWIGVYQLRMRRLSADLVAAEDALDTGDVERARRLVAPLLPRYQRLPIVLEVAADVLYASGDPLSAASFWERAMRSLGAARVAPRLAAAYAALNRPGDVRRVTGLVPGDRFAGLVLAWAELAALGGDRARGARLAAALDAERGDDPAAGAMADALAALAAAQRADAGAMRERLERVRRASTDLRPHDRAFLGYLCGIALRDGGAAEDARAAWTAAFDTAPDSIGGALARRERSHLPAEADG